MSKKFITIIFKIYQQDEEIEVRCDRNKAISEYRDIVSKDKK